MIYFVYVLVIISDILFALFSTDYRFNKAVTYISYGLYGALFVFLCCLQLSFNIIFLISFIVYIILYLILSEGNWIKNSFLLTTYSVMFVIFIGVCICLLMLDFKGAVFVEILGISLAFVGLEILLYKLLIPNFKNAEKNINKGWVKILIGDFIFLTLIYIQIYYPTKITFNEPFRIIMFIISALAYFFSYDVVFMNFKNTISLNKNEIENLLLKEIVYVDPVTTLLNKNSYNTNVKYYKELYEHKKIEKLMLVVIDVDKFKSINDTYGHIKGDEALKAVAIHIQEIFNNKECKVFRVGGDEFAVMIENAKISDIKEKLKNLDKEYNDKIKITVSAGYSYVNFESENPFIEAFNRADKNMYKIKRSKTEEKGE